MQNSRQEVQRQPYSCPADRKGLDRDRVNHFHLPCNLCVLSAIFSLKACIPNEAVRVKLESLSKQQTSDSSLGFLKIENEQKNTAQNNSYG